VAESTRRPGRHHAAILGLALVAAVSSGCASRYFRDAPAPQQPVRHALGDLPVREYWTGLVFNGDKVGFTRTALRAVPGEPGRFAIQSEAAMVLRVFGFGKTVELHAEDVVDADLHLVRFDHDHNLDGNRLQVSGQVVGGTLEVTIRNAGREREQRIVPDGPLLPASAMAFLPIVRGLAVGREYRYRIYSGETQRVLDVEQRVTGFQTSDLFLGSAFRVETAAMGHRTTAWIDSRGLPLLEMTLNGVLISALEGESEARRYLALAALNKRETLLGFSLIRPERPLPEARATRTMTVALSGVPWPPPSDGRQHCAVAPSDPASVTCAVGMAAVGTEGDDAAYLRPSLAAPSDAALVRETASAIVGNADDPEQRVERLLAWIGANIRRTPVDVYSALDVLERREAECQGHAYLFAAFARSLGLPTRVVNGLAYSEQFQGFLYHTWVETRIGASWEAIDPTFAQRRADATHLKLIEGESTGDLLPLVEWVGKVELRMLAVQPAR
jgi:hypothetical protein